jgi:hypothetical protein
MTENEENKPYSNTGTFKDPILRSEYNARNKMCSKCLKSWAAERNTIMREDLGHIGIFSAAGAVAGGPPGAAVGGLIGWTSYLFVPVRYTCKFCGASFCVNKWL